MGVSLRRFKKWWKGDGKVKEPAMSSNGNGNGLNSSTELDLRGAESLRYGNGGKGGLPMRKVRRSGKSREEKKIDKEHDMVLVPSDGVCWSDSESDDDSDWSIGWSEPHGPEFQSDNESDNSFAVIVRCYSQSSKEVAEAPDDKLLNALKNFPAEFSSDGKNYLEHWLACPQNFRGPIQNGFN